MDDAAFAELTDFLDRVPAIDRIFAHGTWPEGGWWVKLSIDIADPLAWHAVQELGHVLNYLSLDERLPTVFKPVSPPPYLNGGPDHYLAWVIEVETTDFPPKLCAEWLEGRLPQPVADRSQWDGGADDEDGYDEDEDDVEVEGEGDETVD